ncbi:MAG: YraN family protein [Chloroflexi bacterium]|nr:YraN family protein [Chloroflexota bacterium]
MSDARKRLGDSGERIARVFLEKNGYRILETNYRSSIGEIDIVARDGDTLVFVEVRTRRGGNLGTPEESVTEAKRAKLIDLAHTYLQEHDHPTDLWRIDMVAIEIDTNGKILRTELIKNVTE